MTLKTQTPERPTGRRSTEKELYENVERFYRSMPDHLDYISNPEYLLPGTEKKLFDFEAPAILSSLWRTSLELDDGQENVKRPQAGSSLSQQNEALLFRRYNCARYHLSDLMEKQMRHFVVGRTPRILRWFRRSLENRSALAQANMGLVVAMAGRTKPLSVEFEELVSEGNMALLRAIDKFDFSRGYKFSSYACCAILKSFGRLAIRSGAYRRRFLTNFDLKLEKSDEMERRRADQQELVLEGLRWVLNTNCVGLTDVENTVLGTRFGLFCHNRVHTLGEVSKLVGLSKERVRQVQNETLAKLRQAVEQKIFSSARKSSDKIDGMAGDSDGNVKPNDSHQNAREEPARHQDRHSHRDVG
jgi:RNA polymerase primary sigma factor